MDYKDSLQQVSEYVQLFKKENLALRKLLKQQMLTLKGVKQLLSE
jgi:hypothetical protein